MLRNEYDYWIITNVQVFPDIVLPMLLNWLTAIITHALARRVFPENMGLKNTTLCFSFSFR